MRKVGRTSTLAAALVLVALPPLPHWSSSLAAQPAAPPSKALPKFPPVPAQDALATFQLRKGFRLELVAAEPLITDPIALAFDEDGRLFVVEMNDYPERGEQHLGHVKRLEDSDGDGRFDKATVFAKGLRWPSAIHCYGGGVFVGSTPDLFYFKDTNDDGVADQKLVALTGWGNRAGKLEPEGVFSSLAWGLDNQIHGLCNRDSGVITNPENPSVKPVMLGGNFAFDPRTMALTVEAGEGQYGMGFNNDGRQFLCRQHRHIMTQLFDRRYADRNPHYPMPSPTVDIAVEGPKAALYRISPEEPWRVMRTKGRVEGLEEGIEAGGRASGYFSAACGLTIYRGNAWPEEYVGDAFVADPGENIVHHKNVLHSGPKASAERPADEQTVEFLASKDTWFRPVQIANAPDGTLYIADMYRQTIEAPVAIPEAILKELDPYAGSDLGRIYRIVPEGFKQPSPPHLSRASLEELVATLEHANGWHRDTAARLLYQRNDRAAVPALARLLKQSKSSLGRLHALYSIKGLAALDEGHVLSALADTDGVVREHAVRLSESFLVDGVPSPELWKKLAACASDPVIGVRYQLAFTLGEIRHPERLRTLAQIARRDATEPMMRAAVLSSLAEGAGEVFTLLASQPSAPGWREILRELASVVGAVNRPVDLERVREALVSTRDPMLAFPLARGLGDGLRRSGSSFEKAGVDLKSLLDQAATTAADPQALASARGEAIALLAYGPAEGGKSLLPLLDTQQPPAVQSAALASLDRLSPPGLANTLLERWSALTPTLREKAVDVLLKRPDRTGALLGAMETGAVQRRDLTLLQTVALRQHRDLKLKQRATKLFAAEQRVADPKDLPKFPPVPAQEALATFQLRKGFRLELVAAEPLVADPIALAFDEDGRLFVIEMTDYPGNAEPPVGHVRRLEDTDGDGRFDKSSVFAKGLRWPSAIHCYGGGVFVGSVPDLLFYLDTDDDGVADQKRVVLTGWGNRGDTLNPEGVFGSLAWGLDNQIHGLVNGFSGIITNLHNPAAKPVTLDGNFAFDPRTMTLTVEAGEGQYGMGFNNDGRQFLCRQHRHIMTQLFDRRYGDRNPHYTMPNPTVDIAVDGPKAALYRISPEEPWRVMRTKQRVEGLEEGIEAGGRASGYFSAACGLTIYRGNAWPEDYVGDAFVADPGENIVHHKNVRHTGPKASAERPADEQTVEFLASKDTWFRPVYIANAPDGTLYIADMYRQIIQAPIGIPEEILKHLDMTAGHDMGRIYRIVPEGFKQPPLPHLSRASLEELVATLEHANGWHRDTAARLLYQRNDRAAVPALSKFLTQSKSSLGRLHALYSLKGLGALDTRHVLPSLSDADAVVREHAVRLSEGFLVNGVPPPELWKKLAVCASDPVIGVRYQLAFTLGEIRHPDRLKTLAQIARRDAAEPMMRAAILSSLAEGAGEMFNLLVGEPGAPGQPEILRELASVVGAANQPVDLGRVRETLVSTRDPLLAFSLARGLGTGLLRSGSSFEKAGVNLQSLLDQATATAADPNAAPSARLDAIALLSLRPGNESGKILLSLLDSQQPPAVQSAALASLDRLSPSGLATTLLDRWTSLAPAMREKVVDVLLKRPDRTAALLGAMEAGAIQPRELTLLQTVALRRHSDARLQQRAIAMLGAASNAGRAEVVRRFLPALELRGDRQRGRPLFHQRCQSCHRLGSEGFAVGPDLAGARNGGKEKLLINILDPNREVPPNYLGYVVDTQEGDSHAGLLVNESAGSVTVRQPLGVEVVVPRSQIARMQACRLSLMPEGLEEGLTHQELADLMAFIFAD